MSVKYKASGCLPRTEVGYENTLSLDTGDKRMAWLHSHKELRQVLFKEV